VNRRNLRINIFKIPEVAAVSDRRAGQFKYMCDV
jgi:hypothetical protein